MARLPRLFLPGCAQHVIQRGNNREACFYTEADYKAYLSMLKDAALKYEVAIHAFVLMTNHVHLLVTPPAPAGLPSVTSSVVESPTPTRSSPAMSSAIVVTGAVTVMVTTTVSGATPGNAEMISMIAR